MLVDRESLLAMDIGGMTSEQIRAAVDKLFGSEPESAIAAAFKTAKRAEATRRLWQTYTGAEPIAPSGKPYRVSHDLLRNLALVSPPESVGHRVTDFSKWILALYWNPSDRTGLPYGKQVERDVARLAPIPSNSNWHLLYRDPLEGKPTPLRISALTVNGQPLWGAPDLVFRHRKNGEVLIIERKASRRELPCDGWPNARAQLWAYAQIDEWRDAPRISLVQEVWGDDGIRVRRRQVVRWQADDPEFRRNNVELFNFYRGTAEQ